MRNNLLVLLADIDLSQVEIRLVEHMCGNNINIPPEFAIKLSEPKQEPLIPRKAKNWEKKGFWEK